MYGACFALQLVSVSRMPRKHTVTYIGGSPVAFRSTPEFSGMLRNNQGAADDICYHMLSLHANSTDQLQRETPVAPCISELASLPEIHATKSFCLLRMFCIGVFCLMFFGNKGIRLNYRAQSVRLVLRRRQKEDH